MRKLNILWMKTFVLPSLTVFSLFFVASTTVAQSTDAANGASKSRVELDDIKIKGELNGDDRYLMMARKKSTLSNRVPLRTSFRREMLQELPRALAGISKPAPPGRAPALSATSQGRQ